MRKNSKQNSTTQSNIGAGAAGVGGGTLLILLVRNLPDDNVWKSWLLILAPTLSIGLSVLWLWLRKKIIEYISTKEFKNAMSQAKATLQEALQNPSTSESHKEQLCKDLERLERIAVDSQLQRVKALVEAE